MDGTPVKEGTPIVALLVPGEEAKLPIHPDAKKELAAQGAAG
jgi:hypothetical protein